MKPEDAQRDRQALEIFGRAIEVAGAEARAACLEEACGGDAALQARVEALLANHVEDSFLQNSAAGPRPTIKLDLTPAEAPAQMLGRYKLLEQIGEGGFGEVWMAEQREPVKRRVALKLIKLGMDSRQIVARFEAERQALAMMDHANIAKIFDASVTDTGRPYFVMELVRGMKITEYCDQNQLPTRERLRLFILVCQAIQHAHQKGIIHRDIKPSNILVTLHDGVPVPKVIDFGIAKATQGELTDKTVFTQFQQFIGTPAYISPEQAEMSGLDIDTRADIYSLGVLLYELLVGQTPFDAKEMMQGGIDALRQIIREREPQRPSTKLNTLVGEARTTAGKRRQTEVGKLVHQFQGDLDWIVMKCLEKDRTRRYETANGVAADLQRHLANEPVVARPPSAAYKFQKAWQRNKLAFAASTAIATVLVVGAGVSTWQAMRATHARRAETEQRKRAEQNEQRALISEETAQRAERDTRQRLYAADMLATQQALRDGNLGQAREYLRNHIPRAGQPDPRGFEWRYYWDQSEGSQLHNFTGHSNPVSCVAFSPDGRWLASGAGGQVFLWDVRERSRLASFQPGGGGVCSVAFHPATDLMAVGTQSEASLWRMTDVRHPALVERHTAREARVAFLPNTSRLVIGQNQSVWGYGFEPGFVDTWDYEQNETARVFENAGGRIALSSDGSVLFTGVRNDVIQRWDLTSGRPPTRADFAWPLRSLGCSPDGRWLITNSGEEDNRAQLWDGISLSPIRTLIRHEEKTDIWGVAFSRDNQLAATTHADQLIRIWTLQTPSAPLILRGHGREVLAASFSPDGALLASAGTDEIVCLWDLQAAALPTVITNVDFDQWQQGPALSPDGKLLAIGGAGATVELWDLDSMRQIGVLTNTAHVLRFSQDGTKLVTLDDTVTLKVWDLARRAPETVTTLTNLANHYRPFALSPDGTLLVGGSRELDDTSTLMLWDVKTGAQTTRPKAHQRALWAIAFFPGGQRFVTCGEDRVARIWNAKTLAQEAEFGGHKNQVFGVAVSSDGALLATASIDGTAKVWNVAERRELWTLKGHKRGVLDAAFNADGKTLTTCSDDGSVRFWNLATGREVGSWQGTRQTCWAVFSADGSRLAIVDNSGTARILDGPATTVPAPVSSSPLDEKATRKPK